MRQPAFQTGSVTLYRGDALAVLREMPDESVDCVITSPPYYGLRSYATNTMWDGGTDPSCDHVRPFVPRSERPSGGSNIGEGSAYNDAQDRGKFVYRDVCGRCGARRVEETVWPGDVDAGEHEHAFEAATRPPNSGGSTTPKLKTKGSENYQYVPETKHATCSICGAWRGQLGLEPTPALYIDHLLLIFREVRRVLRRRGTLWLNMGDSYAAKPGQGGAIDKMFTVARGKKLVRGAGRWSSGTRTAPGVKPKDLLGMPWEVAFALRADGWWLRADIIWAKPNAMPESVIDRPTKSHEYIFLMAKSERYYYDGHAIKEPFAEASIARVNQPGFWQQTGGPKDYSGNGTNANRSARGALEHLAAGIRTEAPAGDMLFDVPAVAVDRAPWEPSTSRGQAPTLVKDERWDGRHEGFDADEYGGRNKRSVWTIPTEPYAEAHFATFPRELPVAPIAAGCPELVCSVCGEPRERLLARTTMKVRSSGRAEALAEAQGIRTAIRSGVARAQNNKSGHMDEPATAETIGWSDCGHGAWVKGTVLDPFAGSGTTLAVARDMGRRAIGIELSEEYVGLIQRRTMQEGLL